MRLIDADEALEYLEDLCRRTGLVKTDADVDYNQFSFDWIARYIETRPTAVTERRGRWIKMTGMMPPEFLGHYQCSECGWFGKSMSIKEREFLHCPHCASRNGEAVEKRGEEHGS